MQSSRNARLVFVPWNSLAGSAGLWAIACPTQIYLADNRTRVTIMSRSTLAEKVLASILWNPASAVSRRSEPISNTRTGPLFFSALPEKPGSVQVTNVTESENLPRDHLHLHTQVSSDQSAICSSAAYFTIRRLAQRERAWI